MDLKEYIENLKSAKRDYRNFVGKFLVKEGQKVLNEAKRRTPVDTGALRTKWKMNTSKLDRNELILENGQEYASYVEYGTKKMDARNMISVPLNRLNQTIGTKFDQSLSNYLKNKGL